MKDKSWSVGIIFILAFSCVISFPLMLRVSVDSSIEVIRQLSSVLLYITACWTLFQLYMKHIRKSFWYFAACLITTLLLTLFFDSIGMLWGLYDTVVSVFTGTMKLLMIFFRGLLIGGLISFVVYYIDVLREKQRNAMELQKLKQKQLEANISSLKEQLSPHFLFNSMNTLKSMVRTNPNGSEDFIVKLSEVYRFLLAHREHPTVTISEELEFVKAYSYLLKSRFGESLIISISIPNEVKACLIPPLTLQLLMENAVKHNIVSKTKPLMIQINAAKDKLVIMNNYQPKSSVETSGNVGLSNIHKRYLLLSEAGITIDKNSSTFQVNIPIIQSS
ncbi:histidine kinase [Fulvivirga maritima]|uniref:sensor histidine kinase n=1 Tax=Fulvivirga maritima TaxID=2904247 RepID=UPI001F19ACC9|nr:histidine kinase [Fulvivirga maritima]UII25665.1 histidine kinase [Fulvivirga maritima]